MGGADIAFTSNDPDTPTLSLYEGGLSLKGKRISVVSFLLVGLIVISGCLCRVIITPPIIALVEPADEATDQPTALILTWEATPGALKSNKTRLVTITDYLIYFSRIDEDYGDPETTPDKQVEKTGLAYGATYKWKVTAVQSDGQTASEERTFSTQETPVPSQTIHRYDSTGRYQNSYDRLSDAVNEANDKDRIEVLGGTVLDNETQQVTISSKEVSIRSSNAAPFVLDMQQRDRVLMLTDGASVTLRRAIITGGEANADGGGVYVESGAFSAIDTTITSNFTLSFGGGVCVLGTFNAVNTKIESNRAFWSGGGVCVIGTFNAVGATIESNVGELGGGVYVESGVFNATDTTVLSNTANWRGGGVCVYGGVFNDHNSTIESNLSYENGGGVVVDGTFNSIGTTIASNTALELGGGVHVYARGTFNALSSSLLSNIANFGGGMYLVGTCNATNTTMASNRADTHGGGTYISGTESPSAFESGNLNVAHTVITSNRAQRGGGVYVSYGTFEAFDTTVASNTANGEYAQGGGVCLEKWGIFNARNTVIASNKAHGMYASGGGVGVYDGAFNATGTTISSNEADGQAVTCGGGVYVGGGAFNSFNTTINANTANGENASGGGVYIDTGGTFNALNTTVSSNAAELFGGGIYWNYEDGGRIYTSGNPWKQNDVTPPDDQPNDFSVDTNGEIKTGTEYSDFHPARVFGNTAEKFPNTDQMMVDK